MHDVKLKGHSVQKLRVETDGRTEGHANAFGKNMFTLKCVFFDDPAPRTIQSVLLLSQFFYFPKYCDEGVCLSVCLRVCLGVRLLAYLKPHRLTSPNLYYAC